LWVRVGVGVGVRVGVGVGACVEQQPGQWLAPISPLHLPYISPTSPLHLPCTCVEQQPSHGRVAALRRRYRVGVRLRVRVRVRLRARVRVGVRIRVRRPPTSLLISSLHLRRAVQRGAAYISPISPLYLP